MKNNLIAKLIDRAGGRNVGGFAWWNARFSIRALKIRLFGPGRVPNAKNKFSDSFRNNESPDEPVCLVCHDEKDLDAITRLAIDLELDVPQSGSLVVYFGPDIQFDGTVWKTLVDRLKHVPVRQSVYLVAYSPEQANLIKETTGLGVLILSDLRLHPSATSKPAIQKKAFSPFACVVTALWGGTGSTLIFDAQTEYLLARGYFVCRIFIEHWPKPLIASKFIDENFERVRPHMHLIAVRTEKGAPLQGRSSVGRTIDALSWTTFLEPEKLNWAVKKTEIVLVNHTAHIGFAKKHFTAPCILETHDIMSDLHDVHGVPPFAERGPDNRPDRWQDETEALAMADHCVCLSHADYTAMRDHAKSISFVRPYARTPKTSERSWQELLIENDAPDVARTLNRFDLLLWGDWHRGNVKSSTWFFDHVHPQLKGHKLQVAVVGRLCEAMPGWISKLEGVHCLGRVDNLHDFIDHSTIMIIYDTSGSGISIKAMETLAAGKPFASLRAGMRQIDFGTTGYLPSETAAEMAGDILDLCHSTQALAKRQRIARTLYEHNFSKDNYDRAWDEVVASVLPAEEKAAS